MKVNSNIKSGFNFGFSISKIAFKLGTDRFSVSAKDEYLVRYKHGCFNFSNRKPLFFNKF